MKMVKNTKFSKAVRNLGLVAVTAFLVGFIAAQAGWAAVPSGTNLKQVQINAGQVDLLFDAKINANQIRTEFFNDIIQLSLSDVSVYPAKISSVSGKDLSKVFVYQYAPKLVRCRLTVKGKAEAYQGKIQVKSNGKIVSIQFAGSAADQVTLKSASAVSQVAEKSAAPSRLDAQAEARQKEEPKTDEEKKGYNEAEEKALLERVLKAAPAAAVPVAAKQDVKKTESKALRDTSKPLTSGKPLPSPFRSFAMLAIVIGVFGMLALALKRLKHTKLGKFENIGRKVNPQVAAHGGGLTGALSRWVRSSLGKNEKMIEVVATHYLGPKKSIAMVRVAGRMLVLGVSNESINLITQLPDDVTDVNGIREEDFTGNDSFMGNGSNAGGIGATSAGPAMFADVLGSEALKPMGPATQVAFSHAARAAAQTQTAPASGVRAQIRNRVGEMKPL